MKINRLQVGAIPFLQDRRICSNQGILGNRSRCNRHRSSYPRSLRLHSCIWSIYMLLFLDFVRSCFPGTDCHCFCVSQRIACWYRDQHLLSISYGEWICRPGCPGLMGTFVLAFQGRSPWCIDDLRILLWNTLYCILGTWLELKDSLSECVHIAAL